jgi:hypothetical protein
MRKKLALELKERIREEENLAAGVAQEDIICSRKQDLQREVTSQGRCAYQCAEK